MSTYTQLTDPKLYINRELSWLEFNQRVLEEASDTTVPLLERVKFLAISASNLDEFFMVRVAGVQQQAPNSAERSRADGLPKAELLTKISQRTHKMVDDQYTLLRDVLLPALSRQGIHVLKPQMLSPEQKQYLASYFTNHLYPVLTPLAIDPGHPFPHLKNKSLNVAILLGRPFSWEQTEVFAVVQVPSMLPRFVEIPCHNGDRAFMFLEEVIAMHVDDLFPGARSLGCWPFRVTRNWDLNIDEEESEDLLSTIQKEVRRRDRGNAVRLEIAKGAGPEVTEYLVDVLHLDNEDLYSLDGPLQLADLMKLVALDGYRELRDTPHVPAIIANLDDAENIFEAISEGDILLHHPFESFTHVVDFIQQAAEDPDVLAIKQTLYRTSGDSPIIRALARAAELGKQVTAIVELKARFDEENNIAWARMLAESGVHVVYGLMGLKTHCKVSLVVRREAARLKRYVHLSTGNYNPNTAKLYTDLSLFTCSEPFGADATALFNMLTGYSRPPVWHRFTVAPLSLQDKIIAMIDAEAEHARRTGHGHIVAKMNALCEVDTIQALYRASQAGVKIDLLVRGICMIRPGIPGISDNIRVTSVVDRFLEHSRIFYFAAGGKEELYLASADWMPRNFIRRVEVMFPIEDQNLRSRVRDEILGTMLADNVKARRLSADGSYAKLTPGDDDPVRSQDCFVELARSHALAEPVSPDTRLQLVFGTKHTNSAPRLPAVSMPRYPFAAPSKLVTSPVQPSEESPVPPAEPFE